MPIRTDDATDELFRTSLLPGSAVISMCGWGYLYSERAGNYQFICGLEAGNWVQMGFRNTGVWYLANNVASTNFGSSPSIGRPFFWWMTNAGAGANNHKGGFAHGNDAFTTQQNSGTSFTPTRMSLLSDSVGEWVDGWVESVHVFTSALDISDFERIRRLPIGKIYPHGSFYSYSALDHPPRSNGMTTGWGPQWEDTFTVRSAPEHSGIARIRRKRYRPYKPFANSNVNFNAAAVSLFAAASEFRTINRFNAGAVLVTPAVALIEQVAEFIAAAELSFPAAGNASIFDGTVSFTGAASLHLAAAANAIKIGNFNAAASSMFAAAALLSQAAPGTFNASATLTLASAAQMTPIARFNAAANFLAAAAAAVSLPSVGGRFITSTFTSPLINSTFTSPRITTTFE